MKNKTHTSHTHARSNSFELMVIDLAAEETATYGNAMHVQLVGVRSYGGGVPEHYDRLIERSRLSREQGGYGLVEGVAPS